jgi:hypothetical protein
MSAPYTPDTVPPDTDQYIYRYVVRMPQDAGMGAPAIVSELMQIWISQP